MTSDGPGFPEHEEDAVRLVGELNAKHDERTSGLQDVIARVIGVVARPTSAFVAMLVVVAWITVNLVLAALHVAPLDRPPFNVLQTASSIAALTITLLILASQRHENVLADHRAQLTLQLAMIADRKLAKLIELVERQRRDNPALEDVDDAKAAEMTRPADLHAILDAVARQPGRSA